MNKDELIQKQRVELHQKRAELHRVFTPTQPINQKALFAGRHDEISVILKAIPEPGRHVILYGERGVGKTSFANVLREFLEENIPAELFHVWKVTAHSYDDFSTIWHNIAKEVRLKHEIPGMGFVQTSTDYYSLLEHHLPDQVSPNDIVRMVSPFTQLSIFIIDEFDRIDDRKTRRLFADTIKALSDNLHKPTLILVGVATDIDQLIDDHASIERNITQVSLARMSPDELREIIHNGLQVVGMIIDNEVVESIVKFSQGFPHYTHLLAKHACEAALAQERMTVTKKDLTEAVKKAVTNASESICNTYMQATATSRESSLFPAVLLACALAEADNNNTFRATALIAPLQRITNTRLQTQNFTYHLGKLCAPDRGPVLEKLGTEKRHRYRFKNPLLKPYILLKAFDEGLLPDLSL